MENSLKGGRWLNHYVHEPLNLSRLRWCYGWQSRSWRGVCKARVVSQPQPRLMASSTISQPHERCRPAWSHTRCANCTLGKKKVESIHQRWLGAGVRLKNLMSRRSRDAWRIERWDFGGNLRWPRLWVVTATCEEATTTSSEKWQAGLPFLCCWTEVTGMLGFQTWTGGGGSGYSHLRWLSHSLLWLNNSLHHSQHSYAACENQ